MTVWIPRHDSDARTTGEVGVHGSHQELIVHLANRLQDPSLSD
ncbi:hypothetical protein [Nonomuraea dietziae]